MIVPRDGESFRLLVRTLRCGDVVAMACDTIYGLVGIVPDSEERIRRIKGRDEMKPFLRLISGESDLERQFDLSGFRSFLDLWPGPFTFIFELTSGGKVGFRVPGDSRLRSLIAEVDSPLFSTSVNRSGGEPLNNPRLIEQEFGGEIAFVEDAGIPSAVLPSTVVDLSVQPPRILRQGAGILPDDLLRAF